MGERIRGRRGVTIRSLRLWREPLCRDCAAEGKTKAAEVVDHIVPLALGGEDIESNCRSLCDEHHRKRTAEQFGHRYKPTTGNDGWPV